MFLMGLFSTLFIIANIFLIFLVVMQKNYGGFWSGPSGNDSVMLFGGNQGADVLQKLTWIFGIILIFGSLGLSIYEASSSKVSRFYIKETVSAKETKPTEATAQETIKEESEESENKK